MGLDTVARRPEGLTPDDRWTSWVAKGLVHDRKIRERARAVLIAIAAGVVLWLSTALLR
jgi:hypothetical protein